MRPMNATAGTNEMNGMNGMNGKRAAPPRPVELLVGMRAIARFLRISDRRVLDMEKRGAPIVRDGKGVLRTEKTEIWSWFRTAPRA